MDLYGLHEGLAQANAVSSEQSAYNQQIGEGNAKAIHDLKLHQGTEKEGDDMEDVKDAINNTVTGFTVHKSAKGYKEAQALKSAKLAKEGKVGASAGALADTETKPMMKVLKSHKFSPDELRAGDGGKAGRRAQFMTDAKPKPAPKGILSGPTVDEENEAFAKQQREAGGGEGSVSDNHPTSDSPAPKSTTDTTTLKDPADKPATKTGGGATGEVGAIEEGGDEAKTGAGTFIKKATGMGGKIADGLGKIGGGIASAGILGDEIYGEVESFKNHPGGSLWQKMSGDNWEQKVGNVGQEIGTAMDLVGTFVPGAQVVGLVGVGISAIGGLLDDIGDAVEHHKKEETTKAEVADPSKAGITSAMTTATPLASAGGIAQTGMSTLRQVSGQA